VAGFQKFDQNMVIKAGVPVIQGFKCRSAWIECSNFPTYGETWAEIEEQFTGNEGRVEIVPQSSHIPDLPWPQQPRHMERGVQRVAAEAEPVAAASVPRQLGHALADAEDARARQ
jgi:hypothetical protein